MDYMFKVKTFPNSEKFRIFKLYNGCIWQIMVTNAYNIGTGESDYFDFEFDDPITAEIICNYLNGAEEDIYGRV